MEPGEASTTLPRAPGLVLVRVAALASLAAIAVAGTRALAEPGLAFAFLLLAAVTRLFAATVGRSPRAYAVDFDPAAIFPAVVILQSFEAGALIATLASGLAFPLRPREGPRSLTKLLDETLDQVLVFIPSGAALAVAAEASRPPALRFAILLVALAISVLVRTLLHRLRDRDLLRAEFLLALRHHGLAALLILPTVLLAVLSYRARGLLGVALALTSVPLASVAFRSLFGFLEKRRELARRTEELAALREVSDLFSGPLADHELATALFDCLRRLFPIRAMLAASFGEASGETPRIAVRGPVESDPQALAAWVATCSPGAREPGKPGLGGAEDRRSPRVAEGLPRQVVLNSRLRYQVVLPLETPELIAGLLVLESDEPSLVELSSLQELSVFADHIALSLRDRTRRRELVAVNERVSRRAETLHRILELSNELKSHLSLDRVLLNIARAVNESLGYPIVLVSLYHRADGVFERRAQVGLDDVWEELSSQRVPRDEVTRFFSDRFRLSKSYFVSHTAAEDKGPTPDPARAGRHSKRDTLLVPLTSGDQLIGVLQVEEPHLGTQPSLEDIQALEIFANQAVTAIRSARAYETTRHASVRDSLTNTFNHRHLQETLHREIARHERSGQTLALAMIDIDDFKKVNDGWGHPVGDVVLRGLVDVLRNGIREMDTLARYGGEEFSIIFPETSGENALRIAERLRAKVEERLFEIGEALPPLRVTVSVGLAVYPDVARSKAALVERADQALYAAKRKGKNQVVIG